MSTYVAANANPADAPEIERAMREFFGRWEDTVDPLADDLTTALRQGDIDLQSLRSIEATVDPKFGEFTNDLELVMKEHGSTSAAAGRAVAGRRYNLDISFDIVPRRTIKQLDDWAVTASDSVSDTLAGEVKSYLRGAHEEGASVDEVARQFREEYIEGDVKGWKARQLARDNTVAPSNAGRHTAHQDASSVFGEEWIDTSDNRTRDSHAAAGGQVVAVDQPFIVGGYRAQYPGDPSLPVSEYTQCRCTTVPVFGDDLSESERRLLAAGQRIWR